MECRLPASKWTEIVWANVYYKQGGFAPYQMMWHGRCYKPRRGDNYLITNVEGLDEIDDPNEIYKFSHARNGNHLTCPFQFDLCQFRNMQKRDPTGSLAEGIKLFIGIRRATLEHSGQGLSQLLLRINWMQGKKN